MKLYAVTIRGYKFYFSGDLSDEVVGAIEEFCNKLEKDAKAVDEQTLFTLLLSHIDLDLGVSVTQVNVDHIFRINF